MLNTANIVALLTDFGTRDHYVGVMKGVILSVNRHAQIVDISHDVDPQDVTSAYFLLQNCYRYFPTGTIFVTVVDPDVGTDRPALCVETPNYLFLAPDNGTLSFLERTDKVTRIFHVTNRKLMLEPVSNTFHGRDVFAPVAGHLSLGLDLGQLGPDVKTMQRLSWKSPEVTSEGVILGEVVSVDKFGNLITNIPADRVRDSRRVEVWLGKVVVKELVRTYGDRKKGEIVALAGSGGMLEIAVAKGSAARKCAAKVGAVVRVVHS